MNYQQFLEHICLPSLPTRAEVRLRTLIQILLSREAPVETSAFRRAGSSVRKRIFKCRLSSWWFQPL